MKEYGSYPTEKELQFNGFKTRNNVLKLVLACVDTEPKWKASSESIKEAEMVVQMKLANEGMKEGTGNRDGGG